MTPQGRVPSLVDRVSGALLFRGNRRRHHIIHNASHFATLRTVAQTEPLSNSSLRHNPNLFPTAARTHHPPPSPLLAPWVAQRPQLLAPSRRTSKHLRHSQHNNPSTAASPPLSPSPLPSFRLSGRRPRRSWQHTAAPRSPHFAAHRWWAVNLTMCLPWGPRQCYHHCYYYNFYDYY